VQFIQINGFQDPKNPDKPGFVNQRLEYFHHYWNFVLREKNRWLLFPLEKLESHRSLFTKINLQLTENLELYPKRLRELIINHTYFSNRNILVRKNARAQKLISRFTQSFVAKIGSKARDNGSKYLGSFSKDLSRMERSLLGKLPVFYLELVLKELITVIHTQSRLSSHHKEDIHFLVNAIIIELYHFGYSPAYIRKLPDIIIYPRLHLFEFPFIKSRNDFSNNNDYNAYTNGVLNQLTLRSQLLAILELAKRPRLKGSYVFKINNFNFLEKTPLHVWDVKFYNPQLIKQLHYPENNEFNEYAEEIEKYFEQYVTPEDKKQLTSTCNAIVPTQYRPLYSTNPDQSVYKAIDSVHRSLSVLKNLKHLHVGGYSYTTEIDLKSVILTHEDGSYHAAPFIQHDYNDDKPFELKDRAKESVKNSLQWLNKLDPKNQFHKKIIDVAFAINRYRYDPMAFSFKDFWITVADALFPNNPEQFVEFASACLELYLRNQMMPNLKIFLHDSLKPTPFSLTHYSLNKKQMSKLDLEMRLYHPIRARKFSNHITDVLKYSDFEFLRDLLDDAVKFQNMPTTYVQEVKVKLRSLIYEVYAERNLEVHNNISTDFSLFKLREFCISLAVIIRLVISQRINTRTKSMGDLRIF
jgi:hypothetical protein